MVEVGSSNLLRSIHNHAVLGGVGTEGSDVGIPFVHFIIMADLPTYIIKPNVMRIVASQLVITFFLAIIFYVGIALNIFLLGISIPININILIISVLLLLVIIQGLLSYVQTSKMQYAIYSNRIQIEGPKPKYIMYNAIQNIKQKKALFDKLFNTGTLVIEPKMRLVGISNFDQTYAYILQMIQYTRSQFNQI